ncbi:phosphate-selective porin OprO/OprP [Pseudomonas fluvialis]|uniref:Phosphate-selective porin OprO/OprP n=1 Tax=Pseudomonas fluvialis TaxID=1793966 RepID=A0A7X0BTW4_9PSED|nr:porin [Pseudomonas fluvialis]MBB6341174.1 phosphate-selective porin OprO/OprP [Pseudomonas fluvialis]
MMRKQFAGFAASALALAVSAQAMAGTVTTDGTDIVIKTKSGLEVSTTDKQYSFKFGGRLQADYDSFDGFYTKNNNSSNEGYLRRAQLEFGGNYKDWRYQMNYDGADLAGSSSKWDEASITYTGFSPINIKLGKFDQDYGLEKATSSKWTTAIERTAVYDLASWVNDKEDGMGIQVSGMTAGMFYGSAGITQQDAKDNLTEDEDGQDTNTFNARGVFAPIVSETEVLHFGLDYAQRSYDDDKFAGKIDSRLGVRGVTEQSSDYSGKLVFGNSDKTGFFDDDQVWGAEFAYMNGPFSVQSEYLTRTLSGQDENGDREATGYNMQLAYTLTGESRIYKLDGAKFDAIKPMDKQLGAWEVFYRFDNLEVEDDEDLGVAGIDTTTADIHTLGVNWYANEAVKVSLNYLMTKSDEDTVAVQKRAADADDDNGNALSLRAQYVF